MTVLVPTSLDGALRALAERPDAHVLAGGTDLMVEVTFGHRRPPAVVALQRVPELRGWHHDEGTGTVTLGAGLTYTEMLDPALAHLLPALAEAARTVGSPQIRNAGTLGGNLGTASPAGDALPVLVALDATVHLASAGGARDVAVRDFLVGPKRTALAPGELVVGATVPVARGWQGYAKVGVRNAMVISVAGVCLAVDQPGRHVAVALGSVGPTVLRAPEAEAWLAGQVDWAGQPARVDLATSEAFGARVAAEARPIDDHRSTAAYRRHAVGILAARLLEEGLPVTVPEPAPEHYVLRVNGTDLDVRDSWLGESLLYVLRERLGLPGAKGACEQGECGSCSVLVDGTLVCSCLVLAAAAVGSEITTVEGLAQAGEPTDVQAAFVTEGAVQCGFCTPGLIVAVHDLLDRNPAPSELEVREALSGNLCRCTGYGRILAAVDAVVAARATGEGADRG